MIENNTKLDNDDLEFFVKNHMAKPVIIVYRIIVFMTGLGFTVYGLIILDYVYFLKQYNRLFFCLVILLAGLFLIYFATLGMKQLTRMVKRKNINIDLVRNIVIDDNGINVKAHGDGIVIENQFDFKLFEGYYYNGKAIYLMLKNPKSFLPIHNDSYINGTYKDVVRLIEQKGIKKI